MNKKYITLFKELAQATANSAETVMDYNHEKNDEQGFNTARTMRDDFLNLVDNIKNAGDDYVPTHAEAARLLVGAMVMVNQLQSKIKAINAAITGYESDLIPKLQNIVDNAMKDDEKAKQMANELFTIESEN